MWLYLHTHPRPLKTQNNIELSTLQQEIRKSTVHHKHKAFKQMEWMEKKTQDMKRVQEGKTLACSKKIICSSCPKNFDQKAKLDLYLEYCHQPSSRYILAYNIEDAREFTS